MAKQRAGQGTQMGLPGVEWTVCLCGCGISFVENAKGRKRDYLNDTHKKRAYRERATERARYDEEAEEVWHGVTDEEIALTIAEEPDTYGAWLGQWELYRRSRP